MRKLILLFAIFLSAFSTYGETVDPLYDTKVMRFCDTLCIENDWYENVTVSMICISPDYFIHNNPRVKIRVKDKDGNLIWKKTLYNTYLYVFSRGQVQIGKPNFNQIVIWRSPLGYYYGMVSIEEGIY